MAKYAFQIRNMTKRGSRWAKTTEMLTVIIDEMVFNGVELTDITVFPFKEEDHDILISCSPAETKQGIDISEEK